MDENKPLVWLQGEIKTPPFSVETRIEAGTLLRRLQGGEVIGLPHSRRKRCHELRIPDEDISWRIVYRTDADAIGEVFIKKTSKTPTKVINTCKRRFKQYDEVTK